MGADQIAYATLVFSSLLAIVNPIGAIPLFIAATADHPPAKRRSTLRLAIATTVITLVAFGLAGTWILEFFGITTTAFRITGGALFMLSGFDMLQARRPREKGTRREEAEAGRRDEIGVIPLGIPVLAGPGAITTIIARTAEASALWQWAVIYAAIFAVAGIVWIVLALAPRMFARLGQTGLNVMTRLMGLLVMVVGVQFIIDGFSAVMAPLIAR